MFYPKLFIFVCFLVIFVILIIKITIIIIIATVIIIIGHSVGSAGRGQTSAETVRVGGRMEAESLAS